MSRAAAETLTGLLAAHVASATAEPLEPATRDAAKAVLLHNLIVGLAAHRMPLPGVPEHGGLPWAARPATAPDLAFETALRMGARAQHDEHPASVTHLGSAVTPGCLALAARDDAGEHLLVALSVGYQVGGALGVALLPHLRARGMRATGVVGPLASAAGAAVMLGLDERATQHALALAANRAAGYTEVWLAGTDEWRLQTAAAARDGLESALWAARGARGAATVLEGPSGLLHAIGAPAGAVGDVLATALSGERVIERMLLKAHPVCAINQAAVEAAIRLRGELGEASLAQVERVTVRLSDVDATYPGIDLAHPPASWPQAMMDARQGVAVALAEGRVEVGALHPGSSAVQRLRGRIDVVGGFAPGDAHGAELMIALVDGRTLASAVDRVEVDAARSAGMAAELLPAAGIPGTVAALLPGLVERFDEPDGPRRLVEALRGIEPWGSLCSA